LADIAKPNAIYYYFGMPIRIEYNRYETMLYVAAFGLLYNFDLLNVPNNSWQVVGTNPVNVQESEIQFQVFQSG